MARLGARVRSELPDSSFAYIDSRGERRLPIHDEAHVRNALARFNQVVFESEAARDRARTRLLKAARTHGIVPVGFIAGQLRAERTRAAAPPPTRLPTGVMTLLMTDIEGSTRLVQRLGDTYGRLVADLRRLLAKEITRRGGHVVEARADETFAVFKSAPAAVDASVAVQRALAGRVWGPGIRVRVRIGVHTGRPTRRGTNYIGMAVHTAARVCTAGHGGQVVVSESTRSAVGGAGQSVTFAALGDHDLPGLPEPTALFQVVADGLATEFPPPRIVK